MKKLTSGQKALAEQSSRSGEVSWGLESRFDAAFVAELALREKQVQQSYRPIISIHKWFARRPGSLFRSLLLSEFAEGDLKDEYWKPQDISKRIADPFMGGGTTIYESLRLGMDVVGNDLNPMSYWLVRQAVEPIDIPEFMKAGERVWKALLDEVGDLYQTTCLSCQQPASVKYFLWAKSCSCPSCEETIALMPSYRIADAVRHPRQVYYCPTCETLTEIEKGKKPECSCGLDLSIGNTKRKSTKCYRCNETFEFSGHLEKPPAHRLTGIEYHCADCYSDLPGRQFKAPDKSDLSAIEAVPARLKAAATFAPPDLIPPGDETDRLLRWGYERYSELFNDRQLLSLGLLIRHILAEPDARLKTALATVFSDFLRYQNLLCRYDTYALKCQDIFSVHGYPVGLLTCENNVPGIRKVGSGSFIHFVEKFARAKEYAQAPYETDYSSGKKERVSLKPEQIDARVSEPSDSPSGTAPATLLCGPSQKMDLAKESLDGVFTDPPYFANVQYAELMDFCYIWLRHLIGETDPSFKHLSTRSADELTGNSTQGRDLENFTSGISEVFCEMADALKPNSPLVFTYHHNDVKAYAPIVVALLDSGLACTAVLPAPAEMAASIHIAGTKSSILDSVFVCRKRLCNTTPISKNLVSEYLARDIQAMAQASYTVTAGDVACLTAGYKAGAAVADLSKAGWNCSLPTEDRLDLAVDYLMKVDIAS